ncbi:hypothetical protein [Nitrosopumilus sp.]|uniref:hypothetical protein n=1 Tax=Nitrosopumilus sp. TaxID=2024843 RepID=UPI002612E39F|nr:hypothetical protein [Nitrosopumilus sp.]
MNKVIFLSSIIAMSILFTLTSDYTFAHPHSGQIMVNEHSHDSQSEIVPLSGMIGLEKTTLYFHTPENNSLPWGFVEGKIANHVEGFPVVIQIFKDGDAVHFAQTSVDQNGNYEYKFRVMYSQNSETINIFDGDYTVKIFKVVYLNDFI